MISLDPSNVDALQNRGVALGLKGDHDKAIADFSEVIRLDSKNVAAYDVRATAYEHKREWKKAIVDLNAAIAPAQNKHTFISLAHEWISLGSCANALADIDAYIRLDPKNPDAWQARGNLRTDGGDFQGAIEDFTKEIDLAPKAQRHGTIEAVRLREAASFRKRSAIIRKPNDWV